MSNFNLKMELMIDAGVAAAEAWDCGSPQTEEEDNRLTREFVGIILAAALDAEIARLTAEQSPVHNPVPDAEAATRGVEGQGSVARTGGATPPTGTSPSNRELEERLVRWEADAERILIEMRNEQPWTTAHFALELSRAHKAAAARITELEAALSATIQGIPIIKAEMKVRIAELEGENARLFKLRVEAAERIVELEAEKQATWDKLVTERNIFATLKAELEAERDEFRKLANINAAMWREAEQDVVNLTEPLKYGDMLCFKRSTVERMAKEKGELEAERDKLKATLKDIALSE